MILYKNMGLDNQDSIKKLDKKNVSASIANLPKQLMNAYAEAQKIKLPTSFCHADNIIFCGMGGSNLASELIRDVFGSQIKVPFNLVRNYHLPSFAGKNSLIIIDSYSGNTEETISCLNQALLAKAKIIVISSGGQLELSAKKNKLAHIKINPSLNPSGQPRYDIGSQLGAVLCIFNKLKFIRISEKELANTASGLVNLGFNLIPSNPAKNNLAKSLANQAFNKNIYILGAQHLSANAHILANQINESAKQLAGPCKIPELNHHFLEALASPKNIVKQTCFILLVTPDYDERISKRFAVTKKILNKQGVKTIEIKATSEGLLAQSLEVLAYGSWLSFYLAMLNKVNPAEIPWVGLFKKELEK